ncbi:LD-carboxypeptidase [Streptomyces avermitilis]|uniref:LD-carboxypeptidase n=1 Tax=Streptomyces avermitilis TaxID=33903 RepID=UPI0033A51F20
MTAPSYPPKPVPGDRMAVISPSSGLPGLLPLPHELGLERLREEFGLEPVEYPATRRMGSTPRERADDIHAAFADPTVRAVIASIGGEDQITVLPLLDRELIRGNPKPFFGYSDNTNLHAFLWNTGPWSFERPTSPEEGARYAAEQRESVLRALKIYAPDTMIVFDVDLGHTDPQVVIPYGGVVRVDGPARRITVTY